MERSEYREIVEWRGDTKVIDPRFAPLRFTCVAEVPLERLRVVIESFGIADDQMSFTYAGAAERRLREEQRRRLLEEKGMTFDEMTNTVRVSYGWVVEKSREDLRRTAAELLHLGIKNNYSGAREMLSVF